LNDKCGFAGFVQVRTILCNMLCNQSVLSFNEKTPLVTRLGDMSNDRSRPEQRYSVNAKALYDSKI